VKSAPASPLRWSAGAALALVLIMAGGRAWAQAPPVPAGTLERAAALVRAREFEEAAAMLRFIVLADPADRRAKEMLAFALESTGDLEGERHVRSALATEFPNDPGIQADYGRVLERSGEEGGALRAYRRARALSAGRPASELDAAIERMRGRTALEVGAPLVVMSDPDATASYVQAGAAIPLGSGHHVALRGGHYTADAKAGPNATASDVLGLSLVLGPRAGAYWTVESSLHAVSPRGDERRDLGVGAAIAGRAPFGSSLEAEWRAEAESPWDEAAIAVLYGGRTTGAGARLYSHLLSQRLLLQAGARRRRLSIVAADPQSTNRATAWQSLWLAGADVVLWRKPGAAVRGEMLDEALIAPTTLSSAVTLAYRHYDVSTQTTPEFASRIGLVPRGSVNETSIITTVAAPRGHLGFEVRAGLARDSARDARTWRAGGSLIWAPTSTARFAVGYDHANEIATGLTGRSRTGRVSLHVDF
jgi:hypothetical protein